MPTCKDICENATNHLEGPTGFLDRISVLFHLLICKECRRFYRQFKLAIGAAPSLNTLETPSDDEIDALVAKLKRQG